MRAFLSLLLIGSAYAQTVQIGPAVMLGPAQMGGAAGGGTAPLFVQDCSGRSFSGTTITCGTNGTAFGGNVTSGHLLVGAAMWENNTSTFVNVTATGTGCASTTWTTLDSGVTGVVTWVTFWGVASGTGTCTPTTNLNASAPENDMVIEEISGQNGSTPIDQHSVKTSLTNGNYNTANSLTTNTVTDTSANNLIFAWNTFSNGTETAGTTPVTFTLEKNAGSFLFTESGTATSSGSTSAAFTQTSANTWAPVAGIITVQP